jgi:predicted HicB family RNase H-like nuclease
METKKPNRKKSKRLTVDVTPKFHQDILDEIEITNETITTYVIRAIRENLEKRKATKQ